MKSQLFFILYGVIFLMRLQEKFDIDHSWERKGYMQSDQFQISPAVSPENTTTQYGERDFS